MESVIYIVKHDHEGTMGLVINRPSTILVRNALAGHFDLPEFDDLVYVGGPVEPQALLILHNASELSGGDKPVVSEVYIGNSEHAFREVVERAAQQDAALHFRIFCGCAGWAPGQLENELARGDWYTVPACRDLIYHEDPYEMYDLTLHAVADAHRVVPDTCPNPQWN